MLLLREDSSVWVTRELHNCESNLIQAYCTSPKRIITDDRGADGKMIIGEETEVFSKEPLHCNYIPQECDKEHDITVHGTL
jgi:hypothetical protein